MLFKMSAKEEEIMEYFGFFLTLVFLGWFRGKGQGFFTSLQDITKAGDCCHRKSSSISQAF